MTTTEYTWDEQRPADGQKIEFYEKRRGIWHRGIYFNDGMDGIVEWADENQEWEVEEYGGHMFSHWREVQP